MTATKETSYICEGVMRFHVTIEVDAQEMSTWEPERISAFFEGISKAMKNSGCAQKTDPEEISLSGINQDAQRVEISRSPIEDEA